MTFSTEDEYELVNITEKELVDFTRTQNSQAWKGQLSSENYVLRESVLGKARITLSRVNRLLVFMLRDAKKPDERLCSSEMLVREAWKFGWNKETGRVEKHRVLSGCIGGVFTYPEHRGKGLARIMIDKLVEMSKSTYVGPEGFTFLYSEVGEYYSRNGFKSFAVPLINFPLGKTDAAFNDAVAQEEDTVELVKYHEFKELFETYNRQFERDIAGRTKVDHKLRVTIDPTLEYADWFHLRAKFISQKLFHKKLKVDYNSPYEDINACFREIEPHYFGIKITNEQKELVGFISWTYDWNFVEESQTYENYVSVLKIYVVPQYDNFKYTQKLILLMKSYLGSLNSSSNEITSNFVKAIIWESEVSTEIKKIIQDEYDGTLGLENGSRSAILMNNDHDNKLLQTDSLVWENNTKLPWF